MFFLLLINTHALSSTPSQGGQIKLPSNVQRLQVICRLCNRKIWSSAIDGRGHGEAARPLDHLHRHLLLRGVRVRPEAELAGAGHGDQTASPERGGVRGHRRRAVRPPGRVPLPGPARAPPLRAPHAPPLPQVRRPPRLRLPRHRRRHQAAPVPHQDPGSPPGRLFPGRRNGGSRDAVGCVIGSDGHEFSDPPVQLLILPVFSFFPFFLVLPSFLPRDAYSPSPLLFSILPIQVAPSLAHLKEMHRLIDWDPYFLFVFS